MPVGSIAPSPYWEFTDNSGNPAAAGTVDVYLAGTLVRANTWQDANLSVLNQNPIQLDAYGRCTVFLEEKTYDIVVKDRLGATIRTADSISSTALGQAGGIGEIFSFDGTPSYAIVDTAYQAGATYDKLHPGTSVFYFDSANLPGTYRIRATAKGDGVVKVSAAIVNLDDGAPDTPLAAATTAGATSTTGEMIESGNITFAASGTPKHYGIKCKIDAAGSGYVWGVSLVRVS